MSTNELLYNILLIRDGRPNGKPIIEAVCEVAAVTPVQLSSRSRKREHVEARQIAIYFMLRTGMYTGKAASQFGRDHSTAIHARNRIQSLYGQKGEKELTEKVDKIADLTGIRL